MTENELKMYRAIMSEEFRKHDYRSMYEVWENIIVPKLLESLPITPVVGSSPTELEEK